MSIIKSKFLLIILGIILSLSFYVSQVHAQNLSSFISLFSKKQIDVVIATPIPTPTAVPWTISQKITEAKNLLKDRILTVGDKPIAYTETRYTSVNGKIAPTTKNFKEPEKQIALAVLDTASGQIQVVTIIKRGADLIAPTGWNINILQRPNGIIWNGWNTAYKINIPANSVVIANLYPNETDTVVAKKVKSKTTYITQRTIKFELYAPYSPDLHSAELVKSSVDYSSNIISRAFSELRVAGVKSRSVSGALVADVFASHSEFFAHIPLLEQTDLTEFEIDPQNTLERVQVIIGANQDQAFGTTCNSSSACGWLQFTPSTYATIVKDYPLAKLTKDFKTGVADHANSMKAAILLYDENLKGLIKSGGEKVLTDPKLEEYLASSYNGSPSHVYKTLAASILGNLEDWMGALSSKTGGLKDETKGYLVKLRYLQQHSISLTSISQ